MSMLRPDVVEDPDDLEPGNPDNLQAEDPDDLEPEDCTDEELGLHWPSPRTLEESRRWVRDVRERWRYLPDDPLPEVPVVGSATVGAVLRALRWRQRLSQRDLAAAAGVPLSVVTRAERPGGSDLRLSTLERLVDACDLQLVVVDAEGTQIAIPYAQNAGTDRADRRPPAHRLQRTPRMPRAVGVERAPICRP